MFQLITLHFVDLLLPNKEKDTPARWTLRIALIGLLAPICVKLF